MDGSGWFNNGGFQTVTINFTPASTGNSSAPEPGTITLVVIGLAAAGLKARRRRLVQGITGLQDRGPIIPVRAPRKF